MREICLKLVTLGWLAAAVIGCQTTPRPQVRPEQPRPEEYHLPPGEPRYSGHYVYPKELLQQSRIEKGIVPQTMPTAGMGNRPGMGMP